MTLYERLYTISWSMQFMLEQQWDDFYAVEKEREVIILKLQRGGKQYQVRQMLLTNIIEVHQRLESTLNKQQSIVKMSLLQLHKGKKANTLYQG